MKRRDAGRFGLGHPFGNFYFPIALFVGRYLHNEPSESCGGFDRGGAILTGEVLNLTSGLVGRAGDTSACLLSLRHLDRSTLDGAPLRLEVQNVLKAKLADQAVNFQRPFNRYPLVWSALTNPFFGDQVVEHFNGVIVRLF